MKVVELQESKPAPLAKRLKLEKALTPENFEKHREAIIDIIGNTLSMADIDVLVAQLTGSLEDQDNVDFYYDMIKQAFSKFDSKVGKRYSNGPTGVAVYFPYVTSAFNPGVKSTGSAFFAYEKAKWQVEVLANHAAKRARVDTPEEAIAFAKKHIEKIMSAKPKQDVAE